MITILIRCSQRATHAGRSDPGTTVYHSRRGTVDRRPNGFHEKCGPPFLRLQTDAELLEAVLGQSRERLLQHSSRFLRTRHLEDVDAVLI